MDTMVKIAVLLSLMWLGAHADLQQDCLLCHQKSQIPSGLIYKRYLLKYSTKSRIEEALYDYLKNPRQHNSIMPAPFFLKFPMKEPTKMDEKILRKNIRVYIDYFDPRKRLRLEE
jgi:hypothetical protein